MIRVCDNGIGMSDDLLVRVFDHGGSVQAQSRGSGKGSEFTVTLPRGDVSTWATTPPRQPDTRPDEPAKQRRVLVVDDNPDSAESLALLARTWGHEVETAADVSSALARAAAFAPDFVLLDIGLPGMDGYEVARRLRELPGAMGARILGITGYGMDRDRQASKDAGIDDHLVKPVDIDRLQKLLQTLGPAACSALDVAAANTSGCC